MIETSLYLKPPCLSAGRFSNGPGGFEPCRRIFNMANEEEDKKTGTEETPEEKKGGIKGLLAGLTGKKRLIVLVAPAVIVIGAGAFFFLRSSAPDGAESAQDVQATAEADKGAEAASGDAAKDDSEEQGDVFELKPFVVNLQDNSGTRYLRLQIGLELKEPVSVERMNSLRPKIRNSLIILLSSKSYRDIGNIQGKYRLRDEIVERINHVMKGDKVKTVYFTEFVVQ